MNDQEQERKKTLDHMIDEKFGEIFFIAKEEYVSGAFGIEGRYPYLDKNVVQEFLWLDSNLKNSFYLI